MITYFTQFLNMLFHLKNSNLKNSKYICTFLKCLCYRLIFFHFATDINYIFNKVLCIFCRAVDTLRTVSYTHLTLPTKLEV